MADISLIQDDALDDCDEGVFEQGDGPSGEQVDDDSHSPLAQFYKYALSDNIFGRRMVPKVLRGLFTNAPAEALSNDIPEIMTLLAKMADQDDTVVRISIFELVPSLAITAQEFSEQVPELANIVGDYLLPMVVRSLGDGDNQLRKIVQSTLFTLIQNGLVTPQQVEIQVCPMVLALSSAGTVMDHHTGTIEVMSKLVQFLGTEVTERVFLKRFSELCTNDVYYVRSVCASHFGYFCAVIGKEAYEKTLLPCYLSLCNDDVWEVRKACVEVVTAVSCPCPPGKRRTLLAPAFAKLLQDESRWVRISAFRTIGSFISTFADPTICNLAYNCLEELVVVNHQGTEFKVNPSCSEGDNMPNPVFSHIQERCSQMEDDEDDDFFSHFDGTKIDITDLLIGTPKCYVPCEENTNSDAIPKHYVQNEDNAKSDTRSFSDNKEISSALTEDTSLETKEDINLLNINFADLVINVDNSYDLDSLKESDSTVLNSENIPSVLNSSGNPINENDSTFGLCDKTDVISNGSSDICNVGFLKNEFSNINEFSHNSNFNESTAENTKTNDQYNSFNFWYVSPEMLLDEVVTNLSPQLKEETPQEQFIVMEHCDTLLSSNLDKCDDSKRPSVLTQDECSELKQCKIGSENVEPPQNIVPQLLIDHFISMTDPNIADRTNKSLPYYCAYSLPAVALTLGKDNWHLLQETVEILAGHIHYKVRKTVASSLHELAIIVGSDMATSNLTPIFDEFIKDLDEVRIGVLKHLADFLGLISQSKRNLYLPILGEFLPEKDIRVNWRFRKELAEQLLDAITLFHPNDVSKHISKVAQELLCDKVAAVRESALQLVTELIRYISNKRKLTSHLLIKLAERFAHSTNWKRRQTFCLLCGNLLKFCALDLEQFASDVMPHLLDLSWDPVPNVRLSVAWTISQQIATKRYFFDLDSQHSDNIHTVLRRLQSDKDRDVRFSAALTPTIGIHQ